MKRWMCGFWELLRFAVDILTGGPHLFAVWGGWFEVVMWHRRFPGRLQGKINAREWKGFPAHTLQLGGAESKRFLRCFWRSIYLLNYKPETWDAVALDVSSPGLEATAYIVFEPVDFAAALTFNGPQRKEGKR